MITADYDLETSLVNTVTELRHDLHRHPELGYKEVRTSGKVREWLDNFKIEYKSGLAGGTGVLGYVPATENPQTAPTVALRADMDALPILEATGRPYSSTNEGVMHACGHDGHTSVLAGTAALLSKTPSRRNNVLLIFQPAEEGGAGGQKMVQDGVLTGKILGKPADIIYGLHGFSFLNVGEVATCDGPMLASADEVFITITGQGGHAAAPHLGADPVVAGAQIVTAMQSIASRNVDPLDSIVISLPMFHAGTAHNVIPMSAEITGTFRTLTPETRALAIKRIAEVATNVATAMGCKAEVRFGDHGYPVTRNETTAAARFRKLIGNTDGVTLMPDVVPVMGGEDFSFYGESGVKACFYWLGLKNPDQQVYPNVHTPEFDFNDAALPVGIKAMAKLALSEL